MSQAPSGKSIKARVYLSPRNEAALDAAVAAVSTPGSPSYRHYITPAQFRAQVRAGPEGSGKGEQLAPQRRAESFRAAAKRPLFQCDRLGKKRPESIRYDSCRSTAAAAAPTRRRPAR